MKTLRKFYWFHVFVSISALIFLLYGISLHPVVVPAAYRDGWFWFSIGIAIAYFGQMLRRWIDRHE